MDRAFADLRRVVALGVLVAAQGAAAESDPDHCLTDKQREELGQRVIDSIAVLTLEARIARDAKPLEAAAVHDRALRALADCEAQRPSDRCDGARSAAKAAANALTAARAEDRGKFGREMSARVADRTKAIRKEYPACDAAPR